MLRSGSCPTKMSGDFCVPLSIKQVFYTKIIFAAVIEVVLLCLIIRYAWKWPLMET